MLVTPFLSGAPLLKNILDPPLFTETKWKTWKNGNFEKLLRMNKSE